MFSKHKEISRREFLARSTKVTAGIAAAGVLSSCNTHRTTHIDRWTFAYVTDIHVGSPRSFRFRPAANENWETARKQIVDINPDFLLLGGDIARDGSIHRWELENIKEDFDSLPFPYYVIPGNMDTGNKHTKITGGRKNRNDVALNMTAEQVEQFESVFGPVWWNFVHKNLRFLGFCDMLMGSGLPQEKKLWQWLEEQKKQPPAKYNIWLMHHALFIDDLHEPNCDITVPEQRSSWYFGIDEPYRSRIMEIFHATSTNRVITGHIHCRKDYFVENIYFDLAPSTAFPQFKDHWPDGDPTLGFFKYDVTEEAIEKTFVPLEKVSIKKGYGPGGHPPPEQRDYSKAWEK